MSQPFAWTKTPIPTLLQPLAKKRQANRVEGLFRFQLGEGIEKECRLRS